jgi:hypothetical protein
MASPTPAQLLEEWRQALDALERFEHGALDETGRARLAELRARSEQLFEQVRAAGLLPERAEPRTGPWAPLPLYDAPAPSLPAHEPALTEPVGRKPIDHAHVLARVSIIYERNIVRRGAYALAMDFDWTRLLRPSVRLLAAVLDDCGVHDEASAARLQRGLHLTKWPDPVSLAPMKLAPPFRPSERDGLTDAQRAVVEALALDFPSFQRSTVAIEDASSRSHTRTELKQALDELLLPRPYPLVERDAAHASELRVRLTPLAMEMLEVTSERARVHGAFVPNLLVNGCGEPLCVPTHNLGEVLAAAKVLALVPGADEQMVASKLPAPDYVGGFQCEPPRALYWRGAGPVDFAIRVSFDHPTAATLTCFPPGVTVAEVIGALEAGRTSGALDGVTSCAATDSAVRYEVESPVFLRAPLRYLHHLGLFSRACDCAFTFEGSDAVDRLVSRNGLLLAFVQRSQVVMAYRLLEQEKAVRKKLERLEELARAAANQAFVAQVLDAALDAREAIWGLTHAGSPEFAAHPAFRSIDASGQAPVSEDVAKQLFSGKARPAILEEQRASLSDELGRLQDAQRPAHLRDRVIAEFERISARFTRPRATALGASLLDVLYLRGRPVTK